MYFSYYFDVKKTHVLNCGFTAETLAVQVDGTITSKIAAYIEEIKDGNKLRREQKTVEFSFPASERVDDPKDYDLDFLRERYAPQEKWIFIIKNNRIQAQNIKLGLISSTANQNPLGMDVFYEEEKFTAELKASNLARLESSYVPPVIEQTLVNIDFTTPGFPNGFTAVGRAVYDPSYKLYEANSFSLIMQEQVQEKTKARISLNLAPTTIDVAGPPDVFSFTVNGLGIFTLKQNAISYLQEGKTEEDRITKTFSNADLPLKPDFFFNYGLRDKSKLTFEADGQGTVRITYGGISFDGKYDANNKITGFTYDGAMDTSSQPDKVKVKLDNILVIYEK